MSDMVPPEVVVVPNDVDVTPGLVQPVPDPEPAQDQHQDQDQQKTEGHGQAKVKGKPSRVSAHKARTYYGGDIVVRKAAQKVWEWNPCFGTVMRPQTETESGQGQDKGSSTSFKVLWDSTNQIENMQEWQVRLADRYLTRNTRVENEDGEVGSVTNLHMTATAQIIGTNHVVERVTLDRLRPITAFIRGQEVLYKDWVGVITTVRRNIWFLLDGGMGFYIPMEEADGFMKTDPYWGVGVACPGIRTKLSSAMMRTAKWTSGPMKFFSRWIPPLSYLYSMAHCTINKSEVTAIDIKWVQLSPSVQRTKANRLPPPERTIPRDKLKNVTVIGLPSSETVGINSVRMLKMKPEDCLTSYPLWLDAFSRRYVDGDESATAKKTPASFNAPLRVLATERVYEVPVKVLHRQTVADVTYSNGSIGRMSSVKVKSLMPVKDDGEFPQGFVVAPVYTSMDLKDYYGVVLESDALVRSRKRKVNVMWISNGNPMDSRPESVFNLRPHPIYSMYQRGTIVFPRSTRGLLKFKAAVVSDLNISEGKLVVTVTADNSQHEVHPHLVTPLSHRCFWNFFTRKWVFDDILPPPYHIETEFDPSKKFIDVPEPSADVLSNRNNNIDADGTELPSHCHAAAKTVWDEPPFELLAFAPNTHRYYEHGVDFVSEGAPPGKSLRTLMEKELRNLKEHDTLPEGIWVRGYENRMDLISAVMVGPAATPYEDALFIFDMQVGANLPTERPKIHHVSYTYEINPIMSQDGNFCVSKINWDFENGQPDSYIANCLAQIQELIFTPEPFFCDTRKEEERETRKGREAARLYNENALLRVMDSNWNLIHSPHEPWTTLIKSHFSYILPEKVSLYESWNLSEEPTECSATPGFVNPSFLLSPVSEGFQEAFSVRVEKFKKIVAKLQIPQMPWMRATIVQDSTADSESIVVNANPDPAVRTSSKQDVRIEFVDPAPEPEGNYAAVSLPLMTAADPNQASASEVQVIESEPLTDFNTLPSTPVPHLQKAREVSFAEKPPSEIGFSVVPPRESNDYIMGFHTPPRSASPAQVMDSQKNLIDKIKGKKKKGRKGKILKNMMDSRSSASASSAGETSSEIESSHEADKEGEIETEIKHEAIAEEVVTNVNAVEEQNDAVAGISQAEKQPSEAHLAPVLTPTSTPTPTKAQAHEPEDHYPTTGFESNSPPSSGTTEVPDSHTNPTETSKSKGKKKKGRNRRKGKMNKNLGDSRSLASSSPGEESSGLESAPEAELLTKHQTPIEEESAENANSDVTELIEN